MSVSSYIGLTVFTLAVNATVLSWQYITWRKIHSLKNEKKGTTLKKKPKRGEQKPIIILINILQGILLMLVFVLGGINVLNASNGGIAALLGCAHLPMGITALLYEFRLVRLGHRIIVRSHNKADEEHN